MTSRPARVPGGYRSLQGVSAASVFECGPAPERREAEHLALAAQAEAWRQAHGLAAMPRDKAPGDVAREVAWRNRRGYRTSTARKPEPRP